jgi:hypothetical protein
MKAMTSQTLKEIICICGFHSAFFGYDHLASLWRLRGTNNGKDLFLKVKETLAF